MLTFSDLLDAGFSSLVPVIPPGANLSPASAIKAEDRGKAPGVMNGDGRWHGFDWRKAVVDADRAAAWERMGANIGIQARHFPGGDIDVLDDDLASIIQQTFERVLGPAPCRIGRWPKRLLMYRTTAPFARRRLWFRQRAGGRRHLVEILGDGQQYVIGGQHPGTGKAYEWDLTPLDIGLDGLVEIDAEKAGALIEELKGLLTLLGCIEIEEEGRGKVSVDRAEIDQQALRGDDLDRLEKLVLETPNTNAMFAGRDDYLRMGYAIKAAFAADPARGEALWLQWACTWEGNEEFPEGNDPETALADYERMKPPFEVGAGYLWDMAQAAGVGTAAEEFEAEDEPAGGSRAIDDRPIQYSDQALKLRFLAMHGRETRYVEAWKYWLVWDGRRWVKDETGLVGSMVNGVCCNASGEILRSEPNAGKADRLASKVASKSVALGVEVLARSERRVARAVDEFDRDPWKLNTTNGVVDLKTGELTPHDATQDLSKIAGTGLGAGSNERWVKFLGEIMQGDQEMIDYLQRIAGYSLTGNVDEHAFFFCYGTGRNGKGVFIETLTSLLGDYANVAPMDTFISNRYGRGNSADLAMMRGARLVTAQEIEDNRRWDLARIKTMTGGDRITCRHLYGHLFTYQPQFKILIAGNHKPGVQSVDEAIRRRIHLLPFKRTFSEQEADTGLKERLLGNLSGVLKWAVDGCLKWQQHGLAMPARVREEVDRYMRNEDTLGQFLEERVRDKEGERTPLMQLYGAFRLWCGAHGHQPMTSKAFANALDDRGYRRGKNVQRQSVVEDTTVIEEDMDAE